MFRVNMDVKGALKSLSNDQKQIAFAGQLAANRTVEERQRLVQDHITTTLTIRQASARTQMRRAVRFARDDRADVRQGKTTATLRILGGSVAATTDVIRRLSSLILRQDDGGAQISNSLYRTQNRQFTQGGFVLPAPGLRTASRGVARKLYPAALGLSARSLKFEDSDDPQRQYKGGAKKRGKGFRKGTKYYFVKENVGIFVREQLGKRSEYDAVWFFRRRINLPKRLNLSRTFTEGLEQQYAANFRGFLNFALRTAR